MASKIIIEYSVRMLRPIWYGPLFSAQLSCMLLIVVPTMLYTYLYSNGIRDMSESILPLTSATLGMCKYIMLFYKRKDITALLKDLQNEWDQRVLRARHPDKNVMNANKFSQRISVGYTILVVLASASVALFPFIITTVKRILGDSHTKLALPMKADFIVDTSVNPAYTIFCLLLNFCVMTSTVAYSGADCLFIGVCLHAAAHIRSLRDVLKDIGKIIKTLEKCDDPMCHTCEYCLNGLRDETVVNSDRRKCNIHYSQLEEYLPEDVVTDQLNQCVSRHNEMIEYVDKLEAIFSHQSTMQFLSSSLTICLSLFQITSDITDTRKVFSFMLYLWTSVLQLYMFAWYGQQLINETSMIAEAAYDCPWYNYSPRFRKSVLLVILRAQRPSGISASNFYYISVQSFAKIINTAASYFTLLNSFKNK